MELVIDCRCRCGSSSSSLRNISRFEVKCVKCRVKPLRLFFPFGKDLASSLVVAGCGFADPTTQCQSDIS